jgi:hypothetical protein
VRFDVSELHLRQDTVINGARLSYDDQTIQLQRGDGSTTDDPRDIQHDAVWNSCVANVGVPNDDWRGQSGLVSYNLEETASRVDRTTWDITNRVRQWFTNPDDFNTGLVLMGFDEGTNFSNDAPCVSLLSSFKLSVDFTSIDPTPTPLVIDVGKLHRIQLSPTVAPVNVSGLGPALPDLVVTRVDTVSYLSSGLGQVCGAGRDTMFTIHVANLGRVPTPDPAQVELSVDGASKATTVVDAIPAGVEKTVTIDDVVLGAGNHTFTVTVNQSQRFQEADFSNNSFTNNDLTCV